jgi:hypothetical protein
MSFYYFKGSEVYKVVALLVAPLLCVPILQLAQNKAIRKSFQYYITVILVVLSLSYWVYNIRTFRAQEKSSILSESNQKIATWFKTNQQKGKSILFDIGISTDSTKERHISASRFTINNAAAQMWSLRDNDYTSSKLLENHTYDFVITDKLIPGELVANNGIVQLYRTSGETTIYASPLLMSLNSVGMDKPAEKYIYSKRQNINFDVWMPYYECYEIMLDLVEDYSTNIELSIYLNDNLAQAVNRIGTKFEFIYYPTSAGILSKITIESNLSNLGFKRLICKGLGLEK